MLRIATSQTISDYRCDELRADIKADCDECGRDCHPDEDRDDYTQFLDNGVCVECNDRLCREFDQEFKYIR